MNERQIIHLSDLHIGYKTCAAKAGTVIDNIIKQENHHDCVIVITGDIVERGSRDHDLAAGLVLVDRLKQAGFPVLICPGNHDYGTGLTNSRITADKFLHQRRGLYRIGLQ